MVEVDENDRATAEPRWSRSFAGDESLTTFAAGFAGARNLPHPLREPSVEPFLKLFDGGFGIGDRGASQLPNDLGVAVFEDADEDGDVFDEAEDFAGVGEASHRGDDELSFVGAGFLQGVR